MAVQILWSGLCVNVLVFASIMLIPCAALHRRTANRFLPRALLVGLCAGLPSTLLVAWGCGLVHRDVQSVRQTSYGDPIEFGASVYLVTTPPSAEWDGFHGTAYTSFGGRSWQAQFTKDQGNNVAFAVACESSIALGWPLHCLSGPAIEHWRQRELADSVIAVTSIPAWWPGLLINWGFYALVITAALTLPTIILRAYRLRRGCCAACGYPLHELTRCPECGVDALRTM